MDDISVDVLKEQPDMNNTFIASSHVLSEFLPVLLISINQFNSINFEWIKLDKKSG